MAVSWCHCSILLHFWLKFNPSQSLPWALRLVLLSHWRHALALCCATLSNQIPSLSVKQAKYILDSCSVPPLPFATNSWHLLTRCWESHAWPRSQDETPLFLMSQQILPCPGSRACSPPVSAKGPFPKQKRRWTVNTKPTDGCFHSKLTPSTGELRLLGDMDHTPWLPQSRLLSHSLLATAPSRHAQATPAPSLLPGAPAGWQNTGMAGSAAQKPWLLQQQPKQALQLPVPVVERRDTAASAEHRAWTITPWTAAICPFGTHSNQLQGEAIWVQFSDVFAVSVRRIKIEGCNTCESSEHLCAVLGFAGSFVLCTAGTAAGVQKASCVQHSFW